MTMKLEVAAVLAMPVTQRVAVLRLAMSCL